MARVEATGREDAMFRGFWGRHRREPEHGKVQDDALSAAVALDVLGDLAQGEWDELAAAAQKLEPDPATWGRSDAIYAALVGVRGPP
jgi:hypothetical protein